MTSFRHPKEMDKVADPEQLAVCVPHQEAGEEEWRFRLLWEWTCEPLMWESPGGAKGRPQV